MSVFSSPGTLATLTRIVTAVSSGGVSSSGELGGRALLRRQPGDRVRQDDRVAVLGLDAQRDLDVELVVLALVGEVDDEVGAWVERQAVGRAGLQRRLAVGRRVQPRPVQARAGGLAAAVAAAARELLVEHVRDGGGLHPVDVGQERRLADLLSADLVLVEGGLDERDDAGLPRDVGGAEDRHLAGDRVDRGVRRLTFVAEGCADLLGDLVEPVAAPFERDQRRLLRALHLARDVERGGAIVLLLGLHAERRDLRLEVLRRAATALGQGLEERGSDLLRGFGGDRRQLAVVVLERVLLLRVAARVDRDDQKQEHEDAADQRDRAADQERLAVGCCRRATASGPRASGARAPAGLVVLVEEGQGWKFVSSARDPIFAALGRPSGRDQ